MADQQTQMQAIQSLGTVGMGLIVLMGLSILFMLFGPRDRSGKTELIGCFVMWIGIIACLVCFAFDPAIRAMKFVNTPAMFPIIGIVAGVLLFSLRQIRKDIYGLLEIGVAIATLVALGREYDAQSNVTIIIGFVGAVYVFVRGLTNIAERVAAAK